MTRQDFRKLAASLTSLVLLSVCLFIAWPTQGGVFSWQSRQKTITKYEHRKMPLRFGKVKAAGKFIELQPGPESQESQGGFDGDDDWMKGLTVSFKNTSDRNIVYFRLDLMFPETEGPKPMMAFPLIFGRRPKDAEDRNYDRLLAPGEEVELSLTDERYGRLRNFLKNGSFDKVTSVRLFLETVIFDDDIMWNGGDLYRRNQNDPNNWLPIR